MARDYYNGRITGAARRHVSFSARCMGLSNGQVACQGRREVKARTIEYQPGGGVRLVETAVADPGPGEVQVRAAACGICAWDLYTYRHGSDAPSAAPAGHEGVGRVLKVGAGVSGLAEGDAVVARGFATVHNVAAERALRIPDTDIPLKRWIVEPVSCVVTGLDHTRARAGDRVAVIG
ncbi:MAG: alcohol dehydrogenase catalytic domain-containing protein, partial [Spirochaetaceae bacterium]|nr:alcohol dehydrogenase catalytic domain-containing protein [Spirochaetaceae bacterium]